MGQPPAVAFRLADSPLHSGGQGSISLEYQTYTSAYLFDTLVTGLTEGTHHSALDAFGAGLVIPLDVVHEILGTFELPFAR